jgi:hypothetical protein
VSLKWAKVVLTKGSWKNALTTASGFKVPRFTVYQTICERLETVNHITDAIECFHEMANELAQQMEGKEAKWVFGEYRTNEADDTSMTVLC